MVCSNAVANGVGRLQVMSRSYSSSNQTKSIFSKYCGAVLDLNAAKVSLIQGCPVPRSLNRSKSTVRRITFAVSMDQDELGIQRSSDSMVNENGTTVAGDHDESQMIPSMQEEARRVRAQERVQQRATYQFAAIAASSLVISLAIFATYYRISWHLSHGEEFPYEELASTLLLAMGGMVGMEMYARWAHRFLWHDNQWGWTLHKSHHEPRKGAFEANDIYAVMNAVPAIFLCGYGFMRPDVVGGLCFGLGLGITLFGISYMFVHDGLVHRRFPVGPIADVPILRRVAVAHQMHHSDKYGGVPFGMFLGPMELKEAGFEKDFETLLAASAPEKKKKIG